MKVVLDIEANALENPTKVWVIVCRCVDTKQLYVFRRPSDDEQERQRFLAFAAGVTCWIGHNILEYDLPHLSNLLGLDSVNPLAVLDTLIISRLADYSRPGGHSIEQYGKEFGYEKIKFHDFSKYSEEMETYCIRDVDITERVFQRYSRIINDPSWVRALSLEHEFQHRIVNSLHNSGFAYNVERANTLLARVEEQLKELDEKILAAFPPTEVSVRTFTPKPTKFGTISKTSVPRSTWGRIHEFEIGKTYEIFKKTPFNPASHKQLIRVLNEAGWVPEDKSQTHVDTERELNRLKYVKTDSRPVDLNLLSAKLQGLKETGWRVNEKNLDTLPSTAPPAARLLAKRILLEARRRTLVEQLSCVTYEIKISKENAAENGSVINIEQTQSLERSNTNIRNSGEREIQKSKVFNTVEDTSNKPTDSRSKTILQWLKSKRVNAHCVKENESYLWITITGQAQYEDFCAAVATEISDGTSQSQRKYEVTSTRIKGHFQGIGAWTHRMSHRNPNVANIPVEFQQNGLPKLLGKELRELWTVPKKRLLVGVDAEGIQLRIFAHIINDPEFTQALVEGKKDDKTDPHSLNQRILGDVCKSRAAAKRFIYALLLGGGINKLAQILECTVSEARQALDRVLAHYTGFAHVKQQLIPKDAQRGYFIGLDGRQVKIPGNTASERGHLAMSGYLQNGEAIVIKSAALIVDAALSEEKALEKWAFVNIVHDEYQMEVRNDMSLALRVAEITADAIKQVGEDLKLRCPLAGSYWNEDKRKYTIGRTWYQTH